METTIFASIVGDGQAGTKTKPMCAKLHSMGFKIDPRTKEAYYICKICDYCISTQNIVSYTAIRQ